MTVFVIHLEAMDPAEEDQGEEKVGELVDELHHPAGVLPNARDKEKDEEGQKTDPQEAMEVDAGDIHPHGLDEATYGNCQQNGKHDAFQDVYRPFKNAFYPALFRHVVKIPVPLKLCNKLFTFVHHLHLIMNDNDIIRGIRENYSPAWRELYNSTVVDMRRKIEPMLSKVRHITFDDVFEEACITLMNHVKDGKVKEGDGTNLSGYLFTICWRIALRQSRREGHPKEPEKSQIRANGKTVAVEPFEGQVISPEEEADLDEEARAFLDNVLKSIPEDCRKLLKRFYWDKMPMKDIAATLGLKNENVAKTKKNRCMEKFKQIARAMLADDEKAEEAVRRTIERNALHDLLEELRQEEAGDLATAALKDRKD